MPSNFHDFPQKLTGYISEFHRKLVPLSDVKLTGVLFMYALKIQVPLHAWLADRVTAELRN